jgi:hypothetical protein
MDGEKKEFLKRIHLAKELIYVKIPESILSSTLPMGDLFKWYEDPDSAVRETISKNLECRTWYYQDGQWRLLGGS